ncbi:MAG TPA: 3-hydroxyacyl-ACP dehydratase FabZ [Devosia sp.]|nr:3-hydroxyacyl-ACP dehydratase FabZ [Devosia sp.]
MSSADTKEIHSNGSQKKFTSLQINDLLDCLPHRYPFLMLDKIININGDESATGIKNVTYNEPIFQGHFPDNPIFPGVLIIEGMAQTAGAIVIAAEREKGLSHLVYMLTIDKAKFRKPAVPGDCLEYHIEKIRRRKNVGRFYARAMVGDTLIAEAEVGAMIVEQ